MSCFVDAHGKPEHAWLEKEEERMGQVGTDREWGGDLKVRREGNCSWDVKEINK